MAQPRRKCKLVNSEIRDKIDLRKYADIIKATIETTVPGRNPEVYASYFSTDPLSQSEAVAVGRALAKVDVLNGFGKTVTTFRLFDGRTCESETSDTPVSRKPASNKKEPKGGRVK